MERSLLFLSFAVGGAVWVCGLLSSSPRRGSGRSAPFPVPRAWLAAATGLPILVFLITLPVRPPVFAAGHGMGAGFLLGGLVGLLAVWTALQAFGNVDRGDPVSGSAAIAAPVGLALMAAAVPSLWLRDSLLDALCGIAIGWLCTVLITFTGLSSRRSAAASMIRLCLALGVGAAALFCSLAALGELRGLIDLVGKANTLVHWGAPGLAFAACLLVLLLLGLLPPQIALRIPLVPLATGWMQRGRHTEEGRAAAVHTWRTVLWAILVLWIGRLVATRFTETGDEVLKTKSVLLKPLFALLGAAPMFHVIAMGVAAALLACWLAAEGAKNRSDLRSMLPSGQANPAAVLTLVAAVMLGFQMMGGFGACLVLTVLLLFAGLTVAAPLSGLHEAVGDVLPDGAIDAPVNVSAAWQLTRLLLLGVILSLYRLFSARLENEIKGVSLTDHYALFGLLVGALLPSALRIFWLHSERGSEGDSSRLLRLLATGLLVLAAPALVVALWGTKCILALLIGLALAPIFDASLASALLALAMSLAVTQWTHHVLALTQLTRDQKIHVLFWTTGITLVVLLVVEYSGRWRVSAGKSGSAVPSKGGTR